MGSIVLVSYLLRLIWLAVVGFHSPLSPRWAPSISSYARGGFPTSWRGSNSLSIPVVAGLKVSGWVEQEERGDVAGLRWYSSRQFVVVGGSGGPATVGSLDGWWMCNRLVRRVVDPGEDLWGASYVSPMYAGGGNGGVLWDSMSILWKTDP